MAKPRLVVAVALLLGVASMGARGCDSELEAALEDGTYGSYLGPFFDRLNYIRTTNQGKKAPAVVTGLRAENRGTATGYGFGVLPVDLWAPFRWEVTAGRVGDRATGPGAGYFCTELDVRGSSPLEFYALCAQANGDGYQVWVASAGVSVVGQVVIPETAAIDLAVIHDGVEMTFLARAARTGEYQTVAVIPHAQGAALVPSAGAASLAPGSSVDFTDFRIVANGPQPEGATAAQGLARSVADATEGLQAALYDLMDAYDGEGVAGHLLNAAEALDACQASILANSLLLGDGEMAPEAAKAVRGAAKAARKGAKLAAAGKPLEKVAASLWSALLGALRAAQRLDPHGLPL